jgi:hypothetical protein
MKKHIDTAPVMAMTLAVMFSTGCFVDESLESEPRPPNTEAMAQALDAAKGALPPESAEVHKPHAPREKRIWKTDQGEITYTVVDGEVLVEGDMLLGPVEQFEAQLESGDLGAYGVGKDSNKWSMPVKYSFANSITSEMRTHIVVALNRLVTQSQAHISFSPCTGLCLGSHIKFNYESGGGCSAHLGQLIWPLVNNVNLDDYCDGRNATGSAYDREIGIIMHEVMHGLGVYHTQSRCDRYNFVSILWNNIESGAESNFERKCSGATDYGFYDFASIMHYGARAFSNGNGMTIVPHDSNNISLMGSRQALAQGDRNVLRGMYGAKCIPTRNYCYSWECGYVDVGCGVQLACGPCEPSCEGSYCSDGSCCPSTGLCSDGMACVL